MGKSGEVLVLERDSLRRLLRTDSELGELFLRTYILRRLELMADGISDALLIGSQHSAGTLRIKEFLTRNGHPYQYVDVERDERVQGLFDRFGIGGRRGLDRRAARPSGATGVRHDGSLLGCMFVEMS